MGQFLELIGLMSHSGKSPVTPGLVRNVWLRLGSGESFWIKSWYSWGWLDIFCKVLELVSLSGPIPGISGASEPFPIKSWYSWCR